MAESCEDVCGSGCSPQCGREPGAAPETCRLNRLGIGCVANVVAVNGDSEQRRRLLEMGFCNGARVEVIRRAPLGDPIEFRIRGYFLSLRDHEAGRVEVGPVQSIQLPTISGAAMSGGAAALR